MLKHVRVAGHTSINLCFHQLCLLKQKTPEMQADEQARTSPEEILERERMDAKNKALNVKKQVRDIKINLSIPSKSEEDLLNLMAEIIVGVILEEKG